MNQTLKKSPKQSSSRGLSTLTCAKSKGRPTGLPSEISDLFPDELVDVRDWRYQRGGIV